MSATRLGRVPLEEDQKEGTRALTQSFIVGKTRAKVLLRIQNKKGHSNRSVTIRYLIDKEAKELGLAIDNPEDVAVEEPPIVLPKREALKRYQKQNGQ